MFRHLAVKAGPSSDPKEEGRSNWGMISISKFLVTTLTDSDLVGEGFYSF